MGIRDRIRDWFGSPAEMIEGRYDPAVMSVRAAAGNVGVYLPKWANNQPQWLPHNIETYDTEGFRKSTLVFRCTQYLANAAGSAPLRVYRMVKNQPTEEDDHPLRALLSRPNGMQGEAQFIAFTAMVMAVAGFCVIEKERDRLGNVIGLWPLRSDWARPIPRGAQPADWEYRVPGYAEPYVLKAEDVIVVTYFDTPDNRLTGIGPLEVALREIGITNALGDYLKSFLDRGAMPMYWGIPSDNPDVAEMFLDQSRVDAFREAFRQRYGGLTNAVDIGIFGGIKDLKQLGFNMDELAYRELNDLSDSRICQVFGIPPVLVGAQVGLEKATYNNTTEMRRSFYEDTMTYLWARLDDAFTRHLLPEFETGSDYSLQFDTSALAALKEDESALWSRAVVALKSGGLTLNDYRRTIGYEPVNGGDIFLMPTGSTPVRLEDLPTFGAIPDEPPALPATVDDDDEGETPSAEDDDEQEEARRQLMTGGRWTEQPGEERSVPPISDEEVLVTTSDVDKAISWFDEEFPDLAGILDAEPWDGDA